MENARDQVQRFINQPSWEKAKSRIAFDATPPRGTPRQWLQRQYKNWFDQLSPIQRTVRQLETFGLAPSIARELSQRFINSQGGPRSKADYDLQFEQADLDGHRMGPGLREILSGLSTKETRDFSTYVALRRAIEKQGQGIRTGFEPDLADPEVRRQLATNAARFEGRRQKLISYSDNQVRLLEQSGLMTPEQVAKIRAANRDYVPFYRVYEGVTGSGAGGGKGGGSGYVNTSSGIMRMKGSDRQIVDPLESIVKNTYVFRELAERNRIGRDLVDAIELVKGGGRIGESILAPMKPVRVSPEEIAQKLGSLGLDPEVVKDLSANPDLALTIFRASDGTSAKDGIFRVWDKGKERLFQVDDKDLLLALTGADRSDARALTSWRKWLARPAGWLRAGATLNPEFIARNINRDQFTAGVYSKYGFVPMFDGARGLFSVIGKDHWYKDWVKAGGKYSGLFEGNNNREVLSQVLKDRPAELRQALALINPRSWLHGLQTVSAALEEATRVAEFRRAKASGLSDLEAANESKDVTLNFAAGGLEAKALNKYITFLNAKFLDLDKFVRAHKERPVQTMLKGFTYLTVPSLITWWLGKDDKLIQNLPEWRKEFFWNMRIPGTENVFSFPKPFLLGSIYGTSVEKALDFAYKRDPNALWKALHSNIMNVGVGAEMAGITTAFRPIIENLTNYSFFTGRPLVNEGQARLSPRLQFTPTTSETAKFVGDKLNVSPLLIDNAVRGYLGSLGRYATDAVDWAFLKFQGADTPARPRKFVSQLPVVRGFTQSPYESSEYLSRFYKAMDLAERRMADFNAYSMRLDAKGAREFALKNRNELTWYNADTSGDPEDPRTMMTELRDIQSTLGDLNKAMVMIQQSRGISAEEKAARLVRITKARNTIVEAAFNSYVHPTDRRAAF
jgi:hypothetical protein